MKKQSDYELPHFPRKSDYQISQQNKVGSYTYFDAKKQKDTTRTYYWYQLSNPDTRKLILEHMKAAQGHSHDQNLS